VSISLIDLERLLRDADQVPELGVSVRPGCAFHSFDLLESELVSFVFFADVARTQMPVSSFIACVWIWYIAL
jgi:hypothetical protein